MAIDPTSDRYVLAGRIVTMGDAGVIDEGALYVLGGEIVAVQAEDASPPPGFDNAEWVRTGGTIYPGLIELHNHLSYNAIPLWEVGRRYMHSGHWRDAPEYKANVTKPVAVLANTAGNAEALVRFVECRCLLGGVTSSQGITLQSNAGVRKLYKGLIRNVEAPTVDGLPAAHPRIGEPDKDEDAYLVKLKKESCYLQHLSEGVNDGRYSTAIKQFTGLQRPDGTWALHPSLCGVHSTALLEEHFAVLADHDASIVWSPLSNLLLYGETTNVAAAKAAGVPVALGSDWGPSGTKNLLGELKVAKIWSDEAGGLFTDEELCRMVTTTPAQILRWQQRLGRLEAGKLADLIVINETIEDPYKLLIGARETSLTLVVIGGIPRVGQRRQMRRFAAVHEEITVGSSARLLDLRTLPGDADLGGLTLTDATGRLRDTLRNLPEHAEDLDDAIAAGWVPGIEFATSGADLDQMPPGWVEPPLRVVLEFEEEDGSDAFIDALQGDDLADWVRPMELEGITVPDDPDFLRKLMHARNLPVFVKEQLPALHGEEVSIPGAAAIAGEALTPDPRTATRLIAFLADERFRTGGWQLTVSERRTIIDQSILMLERYYVHLPMKRTMHAVDPVQRLRILAHELDEAPEEQPADIDFHRELIAVFDSLRDLHTSYRLPRPFRGKVAWLPFLIEECRDTASGRRRFIVSKLIGAGHPESFRQGVEILYWNGVPIERAVTRLARQMPGGNCAARRARAMNSLTLRSLTRGQIPDEEWVTVHYRTQNGVARDEQPWLLLEPYRSLHSVSPEQHRRAQSAGLGLDDQTDDLQQAKRVLLAPSEVSAEAEMTPDTPLPRSSDDSIPTRFPTVFRARRELGNDGRHYGYLRIFTFNVDSADDFVDEFERLLGEFPEAGLIIDLRGNGGGLIHAAERALELLSPKTIQPEPAQFINTPATRELCRRHRKSERLEGLVLEPWLGSMQRSVSSGAKHSFGFPMTSPVSCNVRGQVYQGPKVLIVDGLCYSAADMFIAGFQDHELGELIGVHSRTGAGGANVWSHRLLRFLCADEPDQAGLRRLPRRADLRTAIRRTLRVGRNAGELVEDFGIEPPVRYAMSEADLLEGNRDLIAAAISLLQKMPAFRLTVERKAGVLELESPRADWIQATTSDRPVGTFRVDREGYASIDLSRVDPDTDAIELVAYACDVLAGGEDGERKPVARLRLSLHAPGAQRGRRSGYFAHSGHGEGGRE